MPRLSQLEAEFIRHLDDGAIQLEGVQPVDADGVIFLCPKCFVANGGPVGTHRVVCWFVGRVPDDLNPQPGRWTPSGAGLVDLTFVPGDPPRAVSVRLDSGCHWHGHVRDGSAD